jgi:hypothetical protein
MNEIKDLIKKTYKEYHKIFNYLCTDVSNNTNDKLLKKLWRVIDQCYMDILAKEHGITKSMTDEDYEEMIKEQGNGQKRKK